jgi:hypothetical protein
MAWNQGSNIGNLMLYAGDANDDEAPEELLAATVVK